MPIKPPKGVLAPGHFHHLCYLPCSALERGLDADACMSMMIMVNEHDSWLELGL